MNTIRISSISKSLASTVSYIKRKGTKSRSIANLYYTANYDLTITDEGWVLENKKENTKTIFTDVG